MCGQSGHPHIGARWLRLGLISQSFPVSILPCILFLFGFNISQPIPVSSLRSSHTHIFYVTQSFVGADLLCYLRYSHSPLYQSFLCRRIAHFCIAIPLCLVDIHTELYPVHAPGIS